MAEGEEKRGLPGQSESSETSEAIETTDTEPTNGEPTDRPEAASKTGADDSDAFFEAGVPRRVLLSRLESIIFTAPEPISVRKLAHILNLEGKAVRGLIDSLKEEYQNRGIVLEEVSKGFQFRSHPDNAPIIRDVFKLKPLKISRAALETLAIVAYRQPLTRADAEQIRGVDCGGVLKYLFEKNLVRVIGRKEEPGRPIIYGTTKAFLELFGLKSLSDLPALHEFSELWEEHQKIVDEEAPLADDGDTVEPETEGEKEPVDKTSAEGDTESEEASEKMSSNDKVDVKKEKPNPQEVTTETINQEELKALMSSIEPVDPVADNGTDAEHEAEDDAVTEAEDGEQGKDD
jgi:segregation and condensation protein B